MLIFDAHGQGVPQTASKSCSFSSAHGGARRAGRSDDRSKFSFDCLLAPWEARKWHRPYFTEEFHRSQRVENLFVAQVARPRPQPLRSIASRLSVNQTVTDPALARSGREPFDQSRLPGPIFCTATSCMLGGSQFPSAVQDDLLTPVGRADSALKRTALLSDVYLCPAPQKKSSWLLRRAFPSDAAIHLMTL